MSSCLRLCRSIGILFLFWIGATTAAATAGDGSSLPVRGLIRPLNQAAIGTDIQAVVDEVRFKEGDTFRKGDLLISFDCERQQAEMAAAKAQLREMTLAADSTRYLHQKGAIGRYDLDVASVRQEKAAAELAAIKARIKQCKIFAPYDGRVAELLIHPHETPTGGNPLIKLVDETTFEIEMIAPSTWLRSIGIGAAFKFTIDELNETYSGKLVRIGAAVDPVSQTVKMIGVFDRKPAKARGGMSGSASFEGSSL